MVDANSLPIAILRDGPSDGTRVPSSEPNILFYSWLWLDDHSMKIHCCGDYLRIDHEFSIIEGVRHIVYRWAGWLWGPQSARAEYPPSL